MKLTQTLLLVATAAFFVAAAAPPAQDPAPSLEKRVGRLELFHSMDSTNLPRIFTLGLGMVQAAQADDEQRFSDQARRIDMLESRLLLLEARLARIEAPAPRTSSRQLGPKPSQLLMIPLLVIGLWLLAATWPASPSRPASPASGIPRSATALACAASRWLRASSASGPMRSPAAPTWRA